MELKKIVLEISKKFLRGVKLQVPKMDSTADVFLVAFLNISKQLLNKTTVHGCFWIINNNDFLEAEQNFDSTNK